MLPFSTITALPQALLKSLESLGFTQMTPIQAKAIEPILEGKDILAQSKTGSGKTLAFGLPAIVKTDTQNYQPQTLIITPTRELAQQIAQELRRVASYKSNLKILTLYGGVPLRPQADSLAKGAHILIGTPGRIQDHLAKETLTLDSVKTLILDEADRMLDMGFYDDILKINRNMARQKQTLLFSATFPEKIETLAQSLLKEPLTLKIASQKEVRLIEEVLYEVEDKPKALRSIIQSYQPQSLLIFCNTKSEVIALTQQLIKQGHSAIDLHGDLDQRERQEAVIAFSNGSKRILVATDVASRGLDIEGIELIINYDIPLDGELYTHRIGRTGRASHKGCAITLFSANEHHKCQYIQDIAQKASLKTLRVDPKFRMESEYDTLCLNGGKKSKLRKGDILGTLCKEVGISNTEIGKIEITESKSYIALDYRVVERVLKALKKVKIKKKKYVAWVL